MATSNQIQNAVFSTVLGFVKRQEIALKALSELRPVILRIAGKRDFTDTQDGVTQEKADVPSIGYWGEKSEWEYFIHGLGIKLIHTTTREPIEWDGPDVNTFDQYWFLEHLEWLLEQGTDNEDILPIKDHLTKSDVAFEDVIFELLSQLASKGFLIKSEKLNKYTVRA
jgi:hypothetical protein